MPTLSLSHSFCPPPPSPPSEGIYGVAEWMGVMPSSPSLPLSFPLNLLSLFLVSRQFPRSSAIKSDEDTMTLNVSSTSNMIQGNRNFHVPHEVLFPFSSSPLAGPFEVLGPAKFLPNLLLACHSVWSRLWTMRRARSLRKEGWRRKGRGVDGQAGRLRLPSIAAGFLPGL